MPVPWATGRCGAPRPAESGLGCPISDRESGWVPILASGIAHESVWFSVSHSDAPFSGGLRGRRGTRSDPAGLIFDRIGHPTGFSVGLWTIEAVLCRCLDIRVDSLSHEAVPGARRLSAPPFARRFPHPPERCARLGPSRRRPPGPIRGRPLAPPGPPCCHPDFPPGRPARPPASCSPGAPLRSRPHHPDRPTARPAPTPFRDRPRRLDRPPLAPYLRGLDRPRAELPFRAGPPRRCGLWSAH